jgi:hypothetical protein
MVIASLDCHIRYIDQLKLRFLVLVVEVLGQIFVLVDIPYCTPNIVPSLQKLVGDMASDEPIDAGHEDDSTTLNEHRGHRVKERSGRVKQLWRVIWDILSMHLDLLIDSAIYIDLRATKRREDCSRKAG